MHKSYSDYVRFVRELRSENEGDLVKEDSLIISLQGSVIKPFSFKHLAETLQEKDV